MHSSAFFLLKNKFAFIIRIMYLYSTTYVYEGKIFAFIGLHKINTSCFASDNVASLMGFYHLFQTKTSCFAEEKCIKPIVFF